MCNLPIIKDFKVFIIDTIMKGTECQRAISVQYLLVMYTKFEMYRN